MKRDRIALVVYVNLDLMPGMCHTPESLIHAISMSLFQRMPHYCPTVIEAPEHVQVDPERRPAFIVSVDLDPMLGTMHTKESAQHVVRNILFQRMRDYNPTVSIAPADILPHDNEGRNAA